MTLKQIDALVSAAGLNVGTGIGEKGQGKERISQDVTMLIRNIRLADFRYSLISVVHDWMMNSEGFISNGSKEGHARNWK
jgi:hypothetical protein